MTITREEVDRLAAMSPMEQVLMTKGGVQWPILVVDSREQAPLDFSSYSCTVARGSLVTGDYSLLGLEQRVAVERKTIPDLVSSIIQDRERFERELHRAKALDAFAVVIEGSLEDVRQHNYRSKAKPHAVLQSMTAFTIRYGTTWIWAGDAAGAAYFTFYFLEKFYREAEKTALAIMSHAGRGGA